MATKRKIAPKNQPMDVSKEETHYSVQCTDIRLISSNLKPLIPETKTQSPNGISFRIRAIVEDKKAYSYLEIQVNQSISGHPTKLTGFQLAYVLMGTFNTKQNMPQAELGNFVKMYTLTILWPYAREYATDQFRRAGGNELVLPIINPQVVTEHIVENNLVEVEIIKKKPNKS